MHPEFPQTLIYLNHAGIGPWPARTGRAVSEFATENVARGAADYPEWLAVERRLRERLARLISGAPEDVALIGNTSQGLSLIAYGIDWKPGDNVIINDLEFPSNRMVWESLTARYGVEVRDVRLTGIDDPEARLIEAMDRRTRILPVSAVQYGSGLRMDLTRLGQACRARGTLFCVDAIQALGAIRFDAVACGADLVVADGHKWMLGPEGVGLLYVRAEIREQLRLLQYGWHMAEAMGDFDRPDWVPTASARRFEPGSPNSLGIRALEASLSLLEETGMAEIETRVLENSRHLLARIEAEPDLESLTPAAPHRHAGIVTFRAGNADPETLQQALRRAGVICARRLGGIRFSPHFYNQPAALDEAMDRLVELLRG